MCEGAGRNRKAKQGSGRILILGQPFGSFRKPFGWWIDPWLKGAVPFLQIVPMLTAPFFWSSQSTTEARMERNLLFRSATGPVLPLPLKRK
ncbi:MAG: hypothetical protein GY714_09790 [Desulfobacterales bacterium]|nr:hypothetical protein [Desulfobacterales bacterium]